ncbi:hypothetical protein V6N13_117530 [Hibiscus sabdariffa]
MLSGSIPSVSRDLLSLESIDFSSNNLTGGIANDMFDREIPRQIVNLTLLRQFDSPFNNFTGTIPPQIGNLKNLELLNLGVNNLVGSIPPQVFNISTLWKISVISNQLSGHLPSSIGLRLPNLEGLYVGGNHLVGPFPMSITNASKLTDLEMSSNYFSGSIPDTLGNLRNLTYLHLGFNNLTASGMSFLSSLANCRGLEYLGFENNPLVSGELPGLIGNLSGSLQTFLASRCDIRGSIPSEIGNLSRLIRMELDDNVLTGLIPTTFGELKELQSLSLMENKLQGSVPYELCQLNNLAFLFLTSNNLSGPIPSCLGLNNLLILNLSSNSLSGPLPIDIGKWNVLTKYGNGGIVSTRGDVYSFGILIMETITRKKPTDEMFGEETSLKSWVEKSLSSPPDQVVDPNLLSTSERERVAANDCALSILQVGLECSAELPDGRLNMKEIVTRLKKIRAKFLTDQPLA